MFGRPMAGRGQRLEEAVGQVRAAWRGEPVDRAGAPWWSLRRRSPREVPRSCSVGPARPQPAVPPGWPTGSSRGRPTRAWRRRIAGSEPGSGWARVMSVGPTAPARCSWPMTPTRCGPASGPTRCTRRTRTASGSRSVPGAHVYEPAGDADELRTSGRYLVLTPDECVRLYRSLPDDGALLFHPLVGGLDPEVGWASLELFADRVLPRLRAEEQVGPPGG